jgi:hypothetical protein
MAVLQSVRSLHRRHSSPVSPVTDRLACTTERLAYATERMATVERMATLDEMLAVQTSAANRAAADLADHSVVRRTVMIAGMRQIAMVNFDLLFEFELTVLPDGRPAYPATAQQLVSQADVRRLVPGLTLEATVDLANSAAIWLDLGSIR